MWIYNDFSTSINITQIRLYTMYFDSTGGATALLSNYAAAVSDTAQESWRSLSSMSTYSLMFYTSTAYAIARMLAASMQCWRMVRALRSHGRCWLVVSSDEMSPYTSRSRTSSVTAHRLISDLSTALCFHLVPLSRRMSRSLSCCLCRATNFSFASQKYWTDFDEICGR